VPDTLTSAEQEFARTLGTDAPTYRDVLARYALDLKAEDAVASEGFTVSSAMLDGFLTMLRDRGVAMPDSIWNGAKNLVAEQLGLELARYVFGRPAELRRRVQEDPQVERAIELLRQASDQAELLALAKEGN
jgi:hypothetical protein